MRVAIVTESFLPGVNGVTNSVLRVLEHLDREGHEAIVVAPGTGGPTRYAGAPVVRMPSMPLPVQRSFELGLPSPQLVDVLRWFRPDVCHLASPIMLGAQAIRAASRLGIPSVAVYQTDVAGFARRYHFKVGGSVIWRWLRAIHRCADLTLAPSLMAAKDLRRHGIPRVRLWGRGVDVERFSPAHRDEGFRTRLDPAGRTLVGYVGRLAPEKRVHLLAHLSDIDGCQVVIVGDGSARDRLERRLPGARFTGFLDGPALSAAVASLDVFVHPGADETFCQAAQEALASGVPVVAPAAGGLNDLVCHGGNGLLWAPDDVAAMRAGVELLVGDPRLRRRLAGNARRSVTGRTWEALGTQLVEHYRTVTRPLTAITKAA